MVPAQIPEVSAPPAASLHGGGSRGEDALSGERGEDGPLSPGREGLGAAGRAGGRASAYASLGFLPGQRSGGAAREEWGAAEVEGETEQGSSMLAAIRKGVKLKRTLTDDRSAPRIA